MTVGWELTDEGKQKQLFQALGYFETEQEAKDALLLHRMSPVSPKANITLGELYNEWSESWYKHISVSTKKSYEGSWNYLSVYENEVFAQLRKTHYQKIVSECHSGAGVAFCWL